MVAKEHAQDDGHGDCQLDVDIRKLGGEKLGQEYDGEEEEPFPDENTVLEKVVEGDKEDPRPNDRNCAYIDCKTS